MPRDYEVRDGDGIASIAYEHGLFPGTLWDDPQNQSLKAARENSEVLSPGDVVLLPDKQVKQVEKPTGHRHRFVRKGVPEKLRLRLLFCDKPRSNANYTLDVDGRRLHGTTDGDGCLEHWISPSAREANLHLEDGTLYTIRIGSLDPVDREAGVRDRLSNLGYFETAHLGDVDAVPEMGGFFQEPSDDERTEDQLTLAVTAFQRDQGLNPTGAIDDQTRKALVAAHGS